MSGEVMDFSSIAPVMEALIRESIVSQYNGLTVWERPLMVALQRIEYRNERYYAEHVDIGGEGG